MINRPSENLIQFPLPALRVWPLRIGSNAKMIRCASMISVAHEVVDAIYCQVCYTIVARVAAVRGLHE